MLSCLKNLFKSNKEINVLAPCDGEVKRISEISDEVFKEGVLGDGFFIIPSGNDFYAPIDGTITTIANTNHAITFKPNNSDILILMHIGIDSVKGKGKGIEIFVKEGSVVTTDTKVATIDRKVLSKYATTLETPIIVMKETAPSKIIAQINDGKVKQKDCILNIK